MDQKSSYKIAIVGFGPKGLYSFERLLAQLHAESNEVFVEVHIFNCTDFFGAGDVYRNDQAHCLIMNYANHKINMWPSGFPKPIVEHTLDFVSWLKKKGHYPASPDKFAPRSIVGEYLMDGFNSLVNRLPENIQIFTHTGTVTNVTPISNSYRITWCDSTTSKISDLDCHRVLFTTGHATFRVEKKAHTFAGHNIDFVYPTHEKLNAVIAGSTVGMKGIGLTGIDAILALTETRGGSFKEGKKGFFTYEPSGNEPKKIFPFSRTGLPMVPRTGAISTNTQLYYFTEERIDQSKTGSSIGFEEFLLPLIKKEFVFAYYSVLFKNHGVQLVFHEDFQKVQNQIVFFHQKFPQSEVFIWDNLVNPFQDTAYLTTELVKQYLSHLIQEAVLGEEKSPLIAAVAAWRKISPVFNKVYSFGGLNAASHKRFDSHYFGLFNRLAYGPPVKNIKKIKALIDCGILDFTYAKSAVVEQDIKKFKLVVYGRGLELTTTIDYLINATIPRATEKGFNNPLYRNLIKNGLIDSFVNRVGGTYTPGCLAIDTNGNPIDANGHLNTDLTFYGTPTEGLTFDNDTLSRTRNDFASVWAETTCKTIQESSGTKNKYEREKHLL